MPQLAASLRRPRARWRVQAGSALPASATTCWLGYGLVRAAFGLERCRVGGTQQALGAVGICRVYGTADARPKREVVFSRKRAGERPHESVDHEIGLARGNRGTQNHVTVMVSGWQADAVKDDAP